MNLTYNQTMPLLVIVLCLVIIGALGLIIHLIHKINQQNSTIDHLLTKTSKIEKALTYQTRSIRFIAGTVHNLDSQVRGIQNSMMQGYPSVNGLRPDSEQPQEAGHGYTRTGFGHESVKGVTPV